MGVSEHIRGSQKVSVLVHDIVSPATYRLLYRALI
jgi:hypothetical protein